MKTLYALAVCMLGLVGCSGGGGGGARPLNITGTWNGGWQLDNGDAGALVMAPDDNSGSVQGFAAFANSLCFSEGAISGSVHGHTFSGVVTNGGVRIHFNTTISGPTDDSMDGTIEVELGGDCVGQPGTVTLMRE